MERSFSVRTFWDMPVRDFCSSLNLFFPVLRSLRMRTTHLSPITRSDVSTGHGGRSVIIRMGLVTPYFLSRLRPESYHAPSADRENEAMEVGKMKQWKMK